MSTTHRNFAALATGEIGSRLLGFAAAALLARRLGADGFGILGLAMAVTSYFLVPGLGLQDLAAREVAKRPEEAARLTAGVLRVRVLVALGLLALSAIVALALPKPPTVRAVLALSALTLLPLALNTAWVYKALENTERVAFSMFTGQLVFATSVFVAVQRPEHLLRVPLLQALSELVTAAILLPAIRGGWRASSLREGAHTLRGATTITIGRYLRALTVTADVVMLSFMTSDRDVGLYTAAYRVCFLLTAVASSAHVVFLPALTRTRDDRARGSEVLARSLWLAWVVSIPIIVGGWIVAPDLLSFLFGAAYRPAGTAFRLLLLSVGLLFLHGAIRNVLLVTGRLRLDAAINGAAAVLNVGLNLVLIPVYGILAAAAIMVLTEGLTLVAATVATVRDGWRPSLLPLARPTIAAALMGALLVALPPSTQVMLRVLAGAATYAASLAMMGGLTRDVSAVVHTA